MNILLLLFLSFLCLNFLLLYCYYYSVMYGTVMPVSAYIALAFVWFYPNKLMMMMMMNLQPSEACV